MYFESNSNGTAVTDIAISNNTLLIKGSLLKAKTAQKVLFPGELKPLKYKTRQFKLKKKCKFQLKDDEDMYSFSQSEFMEYLPSFVGINLLIYTNQKGKVYKIEAHS